MNVSITILQITRILVYIVSFILFILLLPATVIFFLMMSIYAGFVLIAAVIVYLIVNAGVWLADLFCEIPRC